ncbi:MAG TPA: undecaprenyl-diphosphate phosphatase, partial [Solirubrobacterales bacterium]
MDWWEAILLGAVEGFTEFLPVSSTGHLTILESALGYSIDDPDVTAFTAIIQVGAVAATIFFLRRDIVRITRAWLRGLVNREERGDRDYRFGWAVLLGSLPIGIVGFVFKDEIETTLRSLWFVGSALILWSGVMWFADSRATQERHEDDVTWRDTLIIGLVQCLALSPGVSRSGATMSAGLLREIDRVAVTRLSFFLSIPALTGAAIFQSID